MISFSWISGWLQTNPIVITICELPNTFALFTKIIANLPVNTTLLTWNWWEDILPSVSDFLGKYLIRFWSIWLIWFNMIQFDSTIWFGLIRFNLIWFDLIWFNLIQFDSIWFESIQFDLFDLTWFESIRFDFKLSQLMYNLFQFQVRNKTQWFLKSWQITLWEPIVKCEKLLGIAWMELLLLPEPFWPYLGNFLNF